MERILTFLSLLIPAFSLVYNPPRLPAQLPLVHNAPLPLQINLQAIASVVSFSPGNLRRTITRLVSYYALFK